jgi:ligand-binding sensor domain-containing protein
VIAEDPADARNLYVGTDIGVYVTVDGGASWSVLGGNLPSTYVHDIVIHPRDRMIVAATHGRGLWVMDAVPVQPAKR